MKRVGIGIAGLGRWGRRYLEVLRQLPDAEVRIGADPDPQACSAAGSVRAVPDFAGLLSDSTVSAVIIATPPVTHYRLARAALESGRDVLVEKPMAISSGEAAELAELAERRGLVLAVGHTPLYSPDFALLHERLERGVLGECRRAVAVRTSSGPTPRPRSNGVLADLAAHDIAMALALLGPAVSGRHRPLRPGVSRYQLQFASGARLDGIAAWRHPPHSRRLTIFGTRAIGRLRELPAGPQASSPLGRQCADFIAGCRTRSAPLSDGRLGVGVVAALELLADSRPTTGA